MKLANDKWMCNSGCSGHYCQFVEWLRNVKVINEQITIGNGYKMMATKFGDLISEVTQINGSKFEVTLKEVKYVSEL
jgi:hypothetical protein